MPMHEFNFTEFGEPDIFPAVASKI